MKKLVHYLWLPLLTLGLLLVVLFTTDPFRSSLPIIIVPFALLFLVLITALNSLSQVLGLDRRVSAKKRLIIVGGLAWLPVMLIILRSIDQLTLRDGLIISIFIVALVLYVSRTNFSQN